MKRKPYFVDYWVYFGEIAREEFATWHEMERFKRQLRPGALLDYGCADTPPAADTPHAAWAHGF